MIPENVMAAIFFIFGSMVGSFLNVCIVRLPQEKSIVFPGSHCVNCKKSISWYDNIPLLSYFILGGQCRSCQVKISPRYLIVEFLTAVLFVLFYQQFGLNVVLLPYLILLGGLIVSTFIDWEHRIIPDEISLGGAVVGLILSLFIPQLHDAFIAQLGWGRIAFKFIIGICTLGILVDYIMKKGKLEKDDHIFLIVLAILVGIELLLSSLVPSPEKITGGIYRYLLSFESSLLGFLVGGGLIYAMGMLGDFLFKKESMGGGDVKLLAMIGTFLGWPYAIITFFLAPFFGAVFGLIQKIRTKESAMAYGPFLSIAALGCIFYGEYIITWITAGGFYH
jgi:leader peptidase (prepilin peptidase)/N-methyltransferase